MSAVDVNGLVTTAAATVIAIATVATSVFAIADRHATNQLTKLQIAQEEAQEERGEAARLAAENVARTLANNTSHTDAKLDGIKTTTDVIHALTNSNLTAAHQSTLDGLRRELGWMLKVPDPSPEALSEIAATKARIAALQQELSGELE